MSSKGLTRQWSSSLIGSWNVKLNAFSLICIIHTRHIHQSICPVWNWQLNHFWIFWKSWTCWQATLNIKINDWQEGTCKNMNEWVRTNGFVSYTIAETPAGAPQVLLTNSSRQKLSGNLTHGESTDVPSTCGIPISLPKVLKIKFKSVFRKNIILMNEIFIVTILHRLQ